MQDVDVRPLTEHEYAVVVTEGEGTTHHRVSVDPDLIDDLGLIDVEEEDLVREGILLLLDRVPGDSLDQEMDLAEALEEYEDYGDELRARLT